MSVHRAGPVGRPAAVDRGFGGDAHGIRSGRNEREDPGDEHRVVPDGRGQAGDPLLLGGDALLPECAEAEAGLLSEAKRGLGSVGDAVGRGAVRGGRRVGVGLRRRGPDGHDARRQNGGERDAAPSAQYFALGRITTWEPSISQWAWSSAKSRQNVPSAFQRCHHISMIPRSAPENWA